LRTEARAIKPDSCR